jgi:Tfp pilus assembly protein PilF
MADMYREMGDTQAEEQALVQYLQRSAPDPEKYRQLAHIYIKRGDYLQAEATLRRLMGMGKADKKLYQLLGEVALLARKQAA